jgi:hypothetical protein
MNSMSTVEATLYTQLQTEQTRLQAEVTRLNAVGSTATSSEKQAAAENLANVTRLLNNWVSYTTLRSDANTALANAYSKSVSATTTLDTLAEKSDNLASSLEADKETKKKIVDINTYYGKQYEAYKELFIIVTIVSICVIAALLLAYTPLEFLSRSLAIAICIIGGSVIVYKIIYMMLTTDTNYDEYNWLTSPAIDNGMDQNIIDISGVNLSKTICIGPLCCGEGTEWNSKQGCVLIQPQDITSA